MEQYVYTYDSFAQRGAEQYVPTERFQVKSSVYLPASDIDLRTGRLQPDRQRRRRTQALMLEKERLDAEDQTLSESLRREYSKSGVRISVRALVLIVAAVLFFCSKSSPAYPINDWSDANIYFSAGKGMLAGRVM